MIELKKAPFYLNDAQVKWVKSTLDHMSLDEKIGQVFCPMGLSGEEKYLSHLVNDLHIGGILYRTTNMEDIITTHKKIQQMAKIPLLLAANLECGGDGIILEGTSLGKPMGVAATDNIKNATNMGKVSAVEGSTVGINWAFAPVVDIDRNFHNPITNVRTFGDSVEKIISYATEYIRECEKENVAATMKHFPGDGCDERDQHLVTTVNSLSVEEWDESYGKIYSTLIHTGVKSVMVGHIAQPAYVKKLNPEATGIEMMRPASLSKELVTGLLREKLGFNGLITTDSTQMMGFSSAMPRSKAIPQILNAGCDVILFTKQLDEDQKFLRDAIEDGVVTKNRLDDAVTRILAMKASLKLPEKIEKGNYFKTEKLQKIGCSKFKRYAKEVADEAITLVRDTQNILPLNIEKYPRIYLNVIEKNVEKESPLALKWKNYFEKEGFEVILRDRTLKVTAEDIYFMEKTTPEKQALIKEMYRGIKDTKKYYDLYVYIVFMENASNNTTVRLNWNTAYGMGDDAPWHSAEIPVLMISVANPYHLFDAPTVSTYINAYDTNEFYDQAVMDKIMGRSEFTGKTPVDPYCGNKYLRMMEE